LDLKLASTNLAAAVLGEVEKGVAFEARASIEHSMRQEARSSTEFKDPSAPWQRRDNARNVISDLRAPRPFHISGLRPTLHHCGTTPIVAVWHIIFPQGVFHLIFARIMIISTAADTNVA
jgi:hypothetical protein